MVFFCCIVIFCLDMFIRVKFLVGCCLSGLRWVVVCFMIWRVLWMRWVDGLWFLVIGWVMWVWWLV